MTTTPDQHGQHDQKLAEAVYHRMADELALLIDRKFEIAAVCTRRALTKPVAGGGVHVSFRFEVRVEEQIGHGCLLLPLAEALTLAGYLMMFSDEEVAACRARAQPDRASKDALVEVGNFIARSMDGALRTLVHEDCRANAEGCQGVAAGSRPAFVHAAGTELIEGQATGRIHDFADFDMTLLMPPIPAPSAV